MAEVLRQLASLGGHTNMLPCPLSVGQSLREQTMTFQHEWWRTLAGLALVLLVGALIVGCQPGGETEKVLNAPGPQNIPAPVEQPVVVEPVTREAIEGGPPEGADEGHIGNPEVVPDLTPQVTRDQNWDCSPTGNNAIDDWKRNAKCGGKLDGE